jgi:hypothetical protein
MSLGPTWAAIGGRRYSGFTGGFYTGLFIMPYYQRTYLSGHPDLIEYGTFFKVPIQLKGPRFYFRFSPG